MDRENSVAAGWSHVLSTTNDLAELEAFRVQIGAPLASRQYRKRIPHLDICRSPRQRALALAGTAVTVYDTTLALMRAYRGAVP